MEHLCDAREVRPEVEEEVESMLRTTLDATCDVSYRSNGVIREAETCKIVLMIPSVFNIYGKF
jgi:hypothetical protein